MMEIISTTPNCKNLLQVSMRQGRRFPKLERVWPSYTPSAPVGDHWTRRYPETREKKVKGDISQGNLEDYRFWAGAQLSWSHWRQCRGCGYICYTELSAKEHTEETSHTTLLVEVYKLLARKRICAECGKENTAGRRWGVNLCGLKCIEGWMFRSGFSETMKENIEEVMLHLGGGGVVRTTGSWKTK